MTARYDILDEPEPLRRPFAGSILFHLAVAGAMVASSLTGMRKPANWGSPTGGGGIGSVAVNPVAKIPLPAKTGPTNPVANDTESQVPEPPATKAKAPPKSKAPEAADVYLKGRAVKKSAKQQAYSPPNKWRDSQPERPSQLYNPGGPAANTPLYGMQGGGQVGVGDNSPFGTQLGYYASILRDQVARNWKTNDIDPRITRAPAAVVTFTLRRDGSVAPGSVKIRERSGNSAVDYSAQRAIYDAAPFPPIPREFPRQEAEIEFRFELRR